MAIDFQLDIAALEDATAAAYRAIFDMEKLSRDFFTANRFLLADTLKGKTAQSYGDVNTQWQVIFSGFITNLTTLHTALNKAVIQANKSDSQANSLAPKIGGSSAKSKGKLTLSRAAKEAACQNCRTMIANYDTYRAKCQSIKSKRSGRSRYATSSLVDSALTAAIREVESKQDQLRALISGLDAYEKGIATLESIIKACPGALKRPKGWSEALGQVASDPSLKKLLAGWGFSTAVTAAAASVAAVSKVANEAEIQAKVTEYLQTKDPEKQKEILAWLNAQPKMPGCPYVQPWQLEILGWKNVTPEMVKGLNETLVQFKIDTPARIDNFLAQASKESEKGVYTIEVDWNGDGFPTVSGGPKYRGAGYIQLTHDYNYEAFSKYENDPKIYTLGYEYVAKTYPWQAAGWWWMNNDMNALVDSGASVKDLTKVVRGSTGTWEERQGYLDELEKLLN